MKFFDVIRRLFSNQYDAGLRWLSQRSFVPGFVQDVRFDADQSTRDEILRKARYFEANSAIVQRLADLFEQYTVGANGIIMVPSTSDVEWNKSASAVWDEWTPYADNASLHAFSTLQSLVARSWLIDGEIFILKTHGKKSFMGQSRPRIQLIEGHRVQTPASMYNREGKSISDGIRLDENGRPLSYFVRIGMFDESYTEVPASDMIHIFEPSRPGQLRGLSMMYAVLNDLHDLDDLQLLEMRAAKDAAEKSIIIETPSGTLNAANMRREQVTGTNQNSAGVETNETRTRHIRDVIGGRTLALKSGEKLSQFIPQRPSDAVQKHWDMVTSKVCAGIGISKLLVLPYSMQGTVVRADLDIQNTFFRSRSAVLGAAFSRVYEYVMQWSILNDPRLAKYPKSEWRKVSYRPPRSVNVDLGRNSTAMLSELEAGARTYQDIYSELGQDYVEQLTQRAREAKLIQDLAVENDVNPSTISKFAAEEVEKEFFKAQ